MSRELRVVLLDLGSPASEEEDLLVLEREAPAILGRDGLAPRRARSVAEDDLQLLRAELSPDDGPVAASNGRLEDGPLVGRHEALDDGLAEPERARDDDHVAKTRVGVEREDHARRREVRADHGLNADREGHVPVIEASAHAIADGSIREEGSDAGMNGAEERFVAADVQEGLLLTGEGGAREVLGRRRGANGELALASHAPGQRSMRFDDRGTERRRQRRLEDRGPRRLTAPRELGGVLDVEAREDLVEPRREALLGEERPIEVGRRGEPIDRSDPLRAEGVEELAE